jgi:predicted RNA-binding protein with PUA-like domain
MPTACRQSKQQRKQRREPRYWLFKSEPSAFSFDDLRASPKRTTPWDGVRNYQARNLLRDEVAVGDGVLFYHSSCDPPHVAGIARVVRGGYPDPLQFDPTSRYHDPASTVDEPRWICVDVRAVKALTAPLPLAALRESAALADMLLLQRGQRLSVQPVTAAEWRAVLALAGIADPL